MTRSGTGRSGTSLAELPRPLIERLRIERLDNGLQVALLPDRRVPLVTSVLCYRVGSRDDPAGRDGLAHFLEHMMFKGSRRFGPGEIDRRTQALGGSNNAYTSHDGTAYFFNFASDRWTAALDMEADRMAGLTLDREEVARERAVILEEIAGYESDPWDALERRVQEALFGRHPYARPILGTPGGLAAIGPEELEAFHGRFYRPGGAVLLLAGDVDGRAVEEAAARFGGLPEGGVRRDPPATPDEARRGVRIERRQGEVPRLLLGLPGPPAGAPDFAPLRLVLTLLAGGRASRLQRLLVEEEQLCVSVEAQISESQGPGCATLAAELIPGVEPAAVEERLWSELERFPDDPIGAGELARSRRLLLADRVFADERIHAQALAAALSLALFDPSYPDRHLRSIMECGEEELRRVGRRYLTARETAVTGWSLPVAGRPVGGRR